MGVAGNAFLLGLLLTKTVPNPPSVYRAVGSIQFS